MTAAHSTGSASLQRMGPRHWLKWGGAVGFKITWENEHPGFAVLHLGLGFPLLHSAFRGVVPIAKLKDKLLTLSTS